MNTQPTIVLRSFLLHLKKITINSHSLENHKRRLSDAVKQIQDYASCFKLVDLDKKGVIYPKVLQSFLMYTVKDEESITISRFYAKYVHEKPYLAYQDLLEALLPHKDYIIVANTISNPPQQPTKFTYSCQKQRIKTIESFTSFILHTQIKYLTEDYNSMKNVTKNSQRIGAILWRLLDRQHNNQLTYPKLAQSAIELGIKIEQQQWYTFLYWYFHSYKTSINRNDFMRMLDIQQQRKRASSACKIQQYKLEQAIYKRAQEDRLRTIRIQSAIKDKLGIVPFLNHQDIRKIVREEHFPYECLNVKTQLKGKAGYSRPKNIIKYAIQRQR